MRIVTSSEDADRGAEHPPRLVDVLAAPRLADEDGRGHAEAEHEGRQQEHDHVGVGGRGERALAEEAADPDRVDRAVQRLEDRGGERRQREGEQGLADRPLRQVAASVCLVLLRLPCVPPVALRTGQGPCPLRTALRRMDAGPGFSMTGTSLPQPLQRRAQPFGLGRFGLMVGARLLDRLGLGALGEIRVGEALRRGCRVPSRRPRRPSTRRAFSASRSITPFERERDTSLRRTDESGAASAWPATGLAS